MNFIERKIQSVLLQACHSFPAVVLTGPRRAGKTYLLRHIFPDATYVQLEDPDVLLAVKSDPVSFLESLSLPAIIDEIQNVPELFSYIRSNIDRHPDMLGQWVMTGSQESLLMAGVSESMAGRAAILRLSPMSLVEDSRVTPLSGGYPEVLANAKSSSLWYSSYIQTYVERDVRSILAVRNLTTFHRFLKLLATRHGQMLNKTALAGPLGISVPTLTEWLGVLEMSGLVTLCQPYYDNAGKRLVKTPKLYFLDSGLVCHLLGIRSLQELRQSPFCGAVFEGFVVSEVLKSQWSAGNEGDVYYFRDEQGLEVDIVYSRRAGTIELVECKSSATVTPDMTQPMRRLAQAFQAKGILVAMKLVYQPGNTKRGVVAVGENVQALPLTDFVKEING